MELKLARKFHGPIKTQSTVSHENLNLSDFASCTTTVHAIGNILVLIILQSSKPESNMENAPATWTVDNVTAWAAQANVPADVVSSLSMNQVDGPTLVTLSKSDLQSELGIASLPARRYLWELLKSLKAQQTTSDFSVAIQVHEQEIQTFSANATATINQGPDAASGTGDVTAVVNELASDAVKQRQVVSDHMMAFRLQMALNMGNEICKDAEFAHKEHDRLKQLLTQEESDRAYAESLATGRDRTVVERRRRQEQQQVQQVAGADSAESASNKRVSSLFGLCVQTLADNKVDVAEAFRTGLVKPLAEPAVVSDEESNETSIDDEEMENRKPAAVASNLFNLPFVQECSVCYDTDVKGYSLACGDHFHCVRCMRQLFQSALRDTTLLPLRCCEVPIDMNVAHDLLEHKDARTILRRVEEKEAKNKMYCPDCASFINLDLVDSTQNTELLCDCGTLLCTECKTSAHQGITCMQNQGVQSGSDDMFLGLSREQGWKQCPRCSILIELRSGCNHMTCSNCSHEFCYNCLQQWNSRTAQCSSGNCVLWEEDRLLEAAEDRVQQHEAARGIRLAEPVRREHLRAAVVGLEANEICAHEWTRSNGYKGDCPNCWFTMYAYGMRCRSDCGSIVCYTCAHHRLPRRGW
eukprot:CAMPEP_0113643124 /NCGR_PEP_ID=MMETSP0017_2-20120614/22667_1 /TAXON_ID=2856 /ORGANISM="Cylindrotheca closterium" /LENGTH=639 /DNA_ID=CAMNT_0000554607 /DNA_START=658 /DNA_END=2574 /DNA_ORIENTATION=+ /assembly_acc=CAM_ASM_000147